MVSNLEFKTKVSCALLRKVSVSVWLCVCFYGRVFVCAYLAVNQRERLALVHFLHSSVWATQTQCAFVVLVLGMQGSEDRLRTED